MSKLNPKGVKKPQVVTRNIAADWYSKTTSENGNTQYAKEPEQLLFEIVTSCKFGGEKGFMSNEVLLSKLHDAITLCVSYGRADFVANVCVYARREGDMRTMPLVAAVMLAHVLRTKGYLYGFVRKLIANVIKRADEALDLYAYALTVFGSKNNVPQAIKKGVGDALNRFDEYQFQKYDRSTGLKFKDLLRIVHPTPRNEHQSALFAKVMTNTLKVAETHEVKISATKAVAAEKGITQQAAKAEVWSDLLKEGKLGYMAAIRNAANITETADDDTFRQYLTLLRNKTALQKSGIFPYQVFIPISMMSSGSLLSSVISMLAYGKPYDESARVQATITRFQRLPAARKNLLISALGDAFDNATGNLPNLGDNVVIYLDTSGSMRSVLLYTLPMVAGIVKAMAGKNFALVGFDTRAEIISVPSDKHAVVIAETVRNNFNGGSTDLRQALRINEQQLGFKPETVVLLSDMQINQCMPTGFGTSGKAAVDDITRNNSILRDAKTRIAVNLRASESTCVLEGEWNNVAGYSDALFDMMSNAARGTDFQAMISAYNQWKQ